MKLGSFSTSLTVKDVAASIEFYKNIGFEVFHDQSQQGWAIMKNQSCVIGLFQSMFEKNMLTFNPGWDADGQAESDYTDIRNLQKEMKSKGIRIAKEVDENSSGPASFIVDDPDGNPIMFDQHV